MSISTARLDGLALFLSGLCLVHCLLTPMAVSLVPMLGTTLLAGEAMHGWLLLLVIPNSAFALTLGCRRHRRLLLPLLGGTGLVLLAAAPVLGEYREGMETPVTVIGVLTLAAAHLANFRECRRAACPEPHSIAAEHPDR